MDLFHQCGDSEHRFIGKSEYGAIFHGCIKIKMSDDSEEFQDADWTVLIDHNATPV